MTTCAELDADRALLLAGPLEPLRAARVEAHLRRCPRCRRAQGALADALGAGRAWSPDVDLDHLEALMAEASASAPPRAAPGALIAAGLAAAAATLLVVRLGSDRAHGHAPAVEPVSRSMVLELPDPQVAPHDAPRGEVRRVQLAPGIRAVASADWDGSLAPVGDHLELTARRGFAVIAVNADAPPLRVIAPDRVLELRDGRALVDVAAGAPSVVGLVAGRASLLGPEGAVPLIAGPGASRARTSAAWLHQHDPFLDGPRAPDPTPMVAARAAPDPRVDGARASSARALRGDARRGPAAAPAGEIAAAIARAEAFTRAGRARDAIAALEEAAVAARSPRASALLRFEAARLRARDPAQREAALAALERLAREGVGEASVQAAVLRCQLELPRDRCGARRCLEALTPDHPAAAEARRVLERTRLMNEPCGS